jgi:hypothetical protein
MNADPEIFLSEYVEAASPAAASPVQDMNSTAGAANSLRSEAPRPLFNGREPAYVLQSERPVHRAIVFLAAEGLSYVEIAERLGISSVTVQYVTKQPWAEQAILDEIHRNGGDAVAAVLQAQALPSVMKLIELRDDEAVAAEVRRKSANDLLDRIYGRPNQPVTHRQDNMDELSDQELQEIVAKAKRN